MVTTTLAIDYWLGGGLKPFYFHLSTFLWYIVLCILLYVIFKKIIDKSIKNKWTGYIALLATALYAFHTANAETINYIISRSDVLSTLCIVASLAIFISYPKLRKWGIYILPAIICIGFKETVLVLPIILFFYYILFEKKLSIPDLFKRKFFKTFYKSVFLIIPILVILGICQYYSLTTMPSQGLSNFSSPLLPYLLTQTFVWVHYFFTFILPLNLSADTDWTVISNFFDDRIFTGLTFIILLVVMIIKTSMKPEQRPIAFGLIWFSVALLPTSVIPLTEVLNDHRIFFPFIGLAFSIVYALGLLVIKYEKIIVKEKKYQVFIWVVSFLVLSGYAYGAHQRNKVWKDEETLWLDVTKKSPTNGRGLMNYGLTQMAKGNYDKASEAFEKALIYNPQYAFLHINLGILKNAMGQSAEAENHFRLALQYGPNDNEPYYYYGSFLKQHSRMSEARSMTEKSLQINPDYMVGLYQIMDIYLDLELWDKLDSVSHHTLDIAPQDSIAQKYLAASKRRMSRIDENLQTVQKNPTPENYLNLSLMYFKKGLFEKCIEACNDALKIKPDYAEAYNNICSAYNSLGKYKEAVLAGEKAVALKSDFTLAKNNLNWARSQLKK
jgi:tetratricopeptide (TPR) repeat protein